MRITRSCASAFSILSLVSIIFLFPLHEACAESTPGSPLAPMDPDVWVEIENDVYDIIVEPGRAESIPIRGWVHCDVSPATPVGTDVHVALTILGYSYMSDYLLFTFDRTNNVEEFTALVPEMPGLSVEHAYNIQFFPEWSMDSPQRNGLGVPATIRIQPLPYGWIHIKEMEDLTFDVGKWMDVELLIENNGNSEIMLEVTVETGGELETEYIVPRIGILEKHVGIFSFRMRQRSGSGKDGKITVKAISSVEGQQSIDQLIVKYQTIGKFQNFMSGTLVIAFIIIGLATFITAFVLIYKTFKKERKRKPA